MTWIRSSRCADAACLEVRRIASGVQVRDGAGTVLVLEVDTWRRFVAAIAAEEVGP